jgi:hypothetical protein
MAESGEQAIGTSTTSRSTAGQPKRSRALRQSLLSSLVAVQSISHLTVSACIMSGWPNTANLGRFLEMESCVAPTIGYGLC